MEDQTLPLLFSSLPDRAPGREAILKRTKYRRILSALSKICVQQELFEILVIRLSTKLDLVCGNAGSLVPETVPELELSAAYAHSILTALVRTITTKIRLGHADLPKYVDRLVSRLYNLFIYSALVSPTNENTPATEPRVIGAAAQIITLVIQTLSVQYVLCVWTVCNSDVFLGVKRYFPLPFLRLIYAVTFAHLQKATGKFHLKSLSYRLRYSDCLLQSNVRAN